ncbi:MULTISPECIES: sensor histidine kinase [unclassified Aureimonas]|uniref:sensor histidine kinase n=1 Tax=unclassified Aureimonas TaxID=2615206 RepID=UPI0006F5CFE3|nr:MULTISPECIES: ATP-binding protein [unclassified Aureimonas]KQT53042.1 hypothetical protein ASG62_14170 [Aureimonas sp. Leaf427]KQT80498.1 hypothetical protein ASG54_08020 [Aureimonas sp. Leaf460]
MRLPDRFRTTSFRLAVGYGLLFVASVLVIMGVTYVATLSQMRGIVRASIAEDMTLFRQAFAEGGDATLIEEVEERTESAASDRHFLLLAADGARLGGNLPAEAWKPGSTVQPYPVAGDGAGAGAAPSSHSRLYAEGVTMGDNRLLVARRSDILDDIRRILLSALFSGCVVTLILALVGGYLVGIGPTKRVDAIAATTRAIVGGRLDLRLPISRRGDELDRLASDINDMLGRIETLVDSLRQVSTDIAHDLRTPLARLRQGLERIGEAQNGAALEKAVDAALAESDAIAAAFDALLRIAQIDAGARKSRFAPLDLAGIAERIADAYGEVAVDAGHRLRAKIEPGLFIVGDADLLIQALANLVENAIHHVPAPGEIRLVAAREGGDIVLEVADDGPGIPEAEREKVFRRLYRLDRSRETPGNGLGLALVASIAELHDARREVGDADPGLSVRLRFQPVAAVDGRSV